MYTVLMYTQIFCSAVSALKWYKKRKKKTSSLIFARFDLHIPHYMEYSLVNFKVRQCKEYINEFDIINVQRLPEN